MLQISVEPKRTPWDLRWNMFQIPVRVHPGFWLMSLILYYSERAPFTFVLVGIACVFFSILVHEFGHALSHVYYGDRHPSVVLYMMGGLCIGSEALGRGARIIMLLWGPGAGFILGGIAYAFVWAVEHNHLNIQNLHVLVALDILVYTNIAWGLVNLLPVYPLDGGQILREWVAWKTSKSDEFAFTVSFYSAIIIAVGFLVYTITNNSRDPRALYPVFLFGSLAYSNYRLRQQMKNYVMNGEGEAPRQPWERDADWWKRG